MLSFITVMFGIFGLFGSKEGDLKAYEMLHAQGPEKTVYQFTMNDIDGNAVSLSDYKGKVMLIVNVASKCGHTPQYADLEKLYEQYKDQGLVILAFPANNFLGQEPGSDEKIKEFCQEKYGVTFPVFSKISVKGKHEAPLYRFLTSKSENGILDSSVKWNFQKYLIDREGKVITFFDPGTKVSEPIVIETIKKVL